MILMRSWLSCGLLLVACLFFSGCIGCGQMPQGEVFGQVSTADSTAAEMKAERARDAFGKIVFKRRLRVMSGWRSDLPDEQKSVIKQVLADPDQVDAAYYAVKSKQVEAFGVDASESDFPIIEKIIDWILEDPQRFVDLLKMIIELFAGFASVGGGPSIVLLV